MVLLRSLRLLAACAVAGTLLLVAHSCTDGQARCLPSNCNGCCRGSVCVRPQLQSDGECGLSGLACRACSDTQHCTGGRCLTNLGDLDGGSEPLTGCGLRGTECCPEGAGCEVGLYCNGGICTNEAPAGSVGAVVNAGGKAIGASCSGGSDCEYDVCLAPEEGFVFGYCSKYCSAAGDCPTGSTCAAHPHDELGMTRVCLRLCADAGTPDCPRAAHVCERMMRSVDGRPVCTPKCSPSGACPGGGLCDGRGFCCGLNNYACCDGAGCGQGLRCGPDGYCRPDLPDGGAGLRATGQTCMTDEQCAGGICLVERTGPGCAGSCYPLGYCTEACGGGQGCATNSKCTYETQVSAAPVCLRTCTADGGQGGCRDGYVCDRNHLHNLRTPACVDACGADLDCPEGTRCQDGFCCGLATFACCGGVGGECFDGAPCGSDGYCP